MPNTAGATDPLSTTLRRQPEPRAQTLSTYEVFSILENRACRTENAQIPKKLHWKLKMERNSSLNNREREKITLEETLRHEIRKQNRGKYWWVNAPFTIWLLSAVVAGFVPYGYSKIQETLEVTQRKNQQAEHTLSEIEFRIRQFDELIVRSNKFEKEIVSIPDVDLLSVSSNGMISSNGKNMLAFYRLAPRLRVAVELGGIYAIPRTDENANVWIGGSGYGNGSLPSGRGYRYEEFSSETLFSLWRQ